MTKKQKAEALIDKRIERAYYAECSGVQIDIMDIGRVFEAGRAALADGVGEPGLRVALRQFVETIRKN